MNDKQDFYQSGLNGRLKSASNIEVHTMPLKFLSMRPGVNIGAASRAKKPLGFKKNIIIGAVLIVVFGSLMGLAAWLFLRTVGQNALSPDLNKPADVSQKTSTPEDIAAEDDIYAPPGAEDGSSDLLDFENWESYVNENFGFEFSYPASWTPASQIKSGEPGAAEEKINFIDKTGRDNFSVAVYSYASSYPLVDWVEENFGLAKDLLESFSLADYTAYKYESKTDNFAELFVLHAPNLYVINFYNISDSALNSVYARILISLKFSQSKEDGESGLTFVPAVDTDKDNLTDAEELLYTSDKNKRDTDKDGYIDGEEVANLYDPLTAGQARIYNSPVVGTFVSSKYNYNIVYPAAWTIKGSDDSIIFQDADGEFVQILIMPNVQGFIDINEWYQLNISNNLSDLANMTLGGEPAVLTSDSLKAYMIFGEYIYSLIYNLGLRTDANFMTTFDMMLKSFKIMNGVN